MLNTAQAQTITATVQDLSVVDDTQQPPPTQEQCVTELIQFLLTTIR